MIQRVCLRARFLLLSAGVWVGAISVNAEDITLTTYYPSPRGVYSQMRIGNGNFTAPSGVLHVLKPTDDGTYAVRVDDQLGDTSPFVITQEGNVGIGTNNPSARLTIANPVPLGTGSQLEIDNYDPVEGGMKFNWNHGSTYNEDFYFQRDGVTRLAFRDGNTIISGKDNNYSYQLIHFGEYNDEDLMTLRHAPNSGIIASLGILDWSPEAQLEVSAHGGPRDLLMLSSNQDSDGDRFIVKNSGNVGIGTVSPATKLHVMGDITTNATTIPSDARFKTNVVPLTGILGKLDQVRAISYTHSALYESLGYPTNGQRELGVIGQELEAVFPELVRKLGQEAYLSVDYSRLTVVLLEAIKELKALVDTHQALLTEKVAASQDQATSP